MHIKVSENIVFPVLVKRTLHPACDCTLRKKSQPEYFKKKKKSTLIVKNIIHICLIDRVLSAPQLLPCSLFLWFSSMEQIVCLTRFWPMFPFYTR